MNTDPIQIPPESNGDEGTQALVGTLRLGFLSLRMIMGVLAVIYIFSGMFILPETKQAYVLRFGKIVTNADGSNKLYRSGSWHFAFPLPIDRVVPIDVGTSMRAETGDDFWYKDTSGMLSDPAQQQADDPSAKLTVGTDYYALTGDYNIIHTRWSMDYTVTDPIAYHTLYVDPKAAITKALDNAVLKALARTKIDDALYAGSETLRSQVLDEAKKIVGGLHIGIEVKTVNLDRKQPPKATIGAFNQVTSAEQISSRRTSEAGSYAEKRIREATGHASRLESEALGYKKQVVSSVAADANYFTELLADPGSDPSSIVLALYNKTLSNLIHNSKAIYVLKPGQEIRIMLNAPLKKKKKTPTNGSGG